MSFSSRIEWEGEEKKKKELGLMAINNLLQQVGKQVDTWGLPESGCG